MIRRASDWYSSLCRSAHVLRGMHRVEIGARRKLEAGCNSRYIREPTPHVDAALLVPSCLSGKGQRCRQMSAVYGVLSDRASRKSDGSELVVNALRHHWWDANQPLRAKFMRLA